MKISHLYRIAASSKLVAYPDQKALARARRAYKRNIQEPGDCAGFPDLLMGLAIAQADIGTGTGWIPRVQKVGCDIAKLYVAQP